MPHFRWYHAPIIAWAVMLEFFQDFWNGDFKIDPKDVALFLICLIVVTMEVFVLALLLWVILFK